MALNAKWDRLMSLRPDLAIVPECASPPVLTRRMGAAPAASMQWVGTNPNKGLAVFAFGDFSISRYVAGETGQPLFLPVQVGGPHCFNLLGSWAFNHRSRGEQVCTARATRKALEDLQGFLTDAETVVAGDLNNSIVWDRPLARNKFSEIAAHLRSLGLVSAYHGFNASAFGCEPHPTYFFRKGQLAYHIDYCFIPRDWDVALVEVGEKAEWIAASDHVPLTITCHPPSRSRSAESPHHSG